jgi:opacity protein-like surface antigen
VEWAFFDNWSGKVEWLFADFRDTGHQTINPASPEQNAIHAADSTLHLIRFGLNYRFGAFGGPIAAGN